MHAFTFDGLSDAGLMERLAALVASERQATAALLAHLAEVEERKLYLGAACSSMYAYCTRVLHFAEEVALKRIRAARIARQFPAILDAIADGRMHVTGVLMLAPHFRDDNVEELLTAASHRSKADIEKLVARLSPRPDLPEQITRIPGAGEEVLPLDPDPVTGQGKVNLDPVTGHGKVDLDPVRDRVQARAPDRYGLQVTIREATRDKLLRAQALLRHRNPGGDLEEVIDRALDALLAVLEKEKFGKTSRPRAAKARAADSDPRYVPNEVRREVSQRDGEQCAFVSDEGVRCTERGFLELDHRTMVCRGGQPTAEAMRWLCGPHNRYEAERLLGKDFMREKREHARARRERAAGQGRVDATAMTDAVEACVDAVETRATCPRSVADGKSTNAEGADAKAMDATHAAPVTEPTGARVESAGLRAQEVEREVTLAMRGMGFGASETRRAMADSARIEATSFEARLRAALAAWRASRSSRCSEGPFDEAGGQLAMLLAGKAAAAAFDSR